MRPFDFQNRFSRNLLVLLVVCTFIVVSVSKSKNKEKDSRECKRNNGDDDDDDDSKTLSGDKLLNYLSSKGPYRFDGKNDKQEEYLPFKECKATKIWYFGRHGTRNPGKKDTIRMEKLLPSIRDKIVSAHDACQGQLSKKQVKKLKEWAMTEDVTLENESNLVKQGAKELIGIGKRYRKRFPHLFHNDSSPKIHIKSTKSQRTIASSLAFAQGAFDKSASDVSETIFDPPIKSDPVLKFYENCQKWAEQVDDNPSAYSELTNFESSTIMNHTISQVSDKLGFIDEGLTLEEVTIIYTTCAFETAWKNGKASAWCAAFSKEDLQVMAYREDLEYFWKDGYGHEVNYEQACVPIQDLLEYFRNKTHMTTVRAYFSHSGATLKMIARLGLFEDKISLTSAGFREVKNSYKWRTSLIDMMGTNLAFTLYECKNRPDPEIGFFFQEKPTKISGCDNKWHCPFNQFQDALSNKIGNCDFNMTCSL